MSNILTERSYGGEYLISEANRGRSRDAGVIAINQALKAGSVLGQVSIGALSAVGAAIAGNTSGSGAITASPTVAAGTPTGVYRAICVEPAANAGLFRVEGPDGVEIGEATVAVAFNKGGLGFTIADATDFVAGDGFTITVTDAAAADEGQYKAVNPAATDGSQVACAICYDAVTTTSATAPATLHKRDCEVEAALLDFNSLNNGQIATAKAQLASAGIICR